MNVARRIAMVLAIFCAVPAMAGASESAAPESARALGARDLRILAEAAGRAADFELREKGVPAIAVALVTRDGAQDIRAWGHADAAGVRPIRPDHAYRIGSITKVLTGIAVMRLVEQGRLDLDVPISTYLPRFRPANRYGGGITLRMLLAHRSGLVREPPRGHYFDFRSKGQADAVASLNNTELLTAPGSATKYSNAGFAVVGEVIARVTGKPYERALDDLVLRPAGMEDARFAMEDAAHPLAYGEMRRPDGGRFQGPRFPLGTPAGGGLITTPQDLARLMKVLLRGGEGVMQGATLRQMWTPQYPAGGEERGLAFRIYDLDGQKMIGHVGEVYGYSTQLLLLPDSGLGVAVFSTVDAGPTAQRLAFHILRSALALQRGAAPPVYFQTERVSGDAARALVGHYADAEGSVDLAIAGGRLMLDAPEIAGEVRQREGRFYIDDGQTFDESLSIAGDHNSLTLGSRIFVRRSQAEQHAIAADFAGLIGDYGWDFNVMRIYARDGKPWSRIEWTDSRPLARVSANRYALASPSSLYAGESLTFERDARGRGTAALLNGIRFPRRPDATQGARR